MQCSIILTHITTKPDCVSKPLQCQVWCNNYDNYYIIGVMFVPSLTNFHPLFLSCCIQCHVMLDRVMIGLDCISIPQQYQVWYDNSCHSCFIQCHVILDHVMIGLNCISIPQQYQVWYDNSCHSCFIQCHVILDHVITGLDFISIPQQHQVSCYNYAIS